MAKDASENSNNEADKKLFASILENIRNKKNLEFIEVETIEDALCSPNTHSVELAPGQQTTRANDRLHLGHLHDNRAFVQEKVAQSSESRHNITNHVDQPQRRSLNNNSASKTDTSRIMETATSRHRDDSASNLYAQESNSRRNSAVPAHQQVHYQMNIYNVNCFISYCYYILDS